MSRLIVVCGAAATGKTTWARLVARALRGALFDLDTASSLLVAAAQRELGRDPFDRDSPDYKRVFREPIHETLFALIRDAACEAVLVAPFTSERRLPNFPDLLAARAPGRSITIHYFAATGDRRRARFEDRGEGRDRAKLDGRAAYDVDAAPESPPPYPHTYFDTTVAFPGDAALAQVFGTSNAHLGR